MNYNIKSKLCEKCTSKLEASLRKRSVCYISSASTASAANRHGTLLVLRVKMIKLLSLALVIFKVTSGSTSKYSTIVFKFHIFFS